MPTNSGPPANVGAPIGAAPQAGSTGSVNGPTAPPASGTNTTGMPPGTNTPSGANSPPGGPTSMGPNTPATPNMPTTPNMPVAGSTGAGGMAGSEPAMAGGPGPTPTPSGGMQPKVPALTAQCPAFRDSNITFMGLSGIAVAAGAKAASAASAPMVFYWHGTLSSSGEYVLMASAVHQGVVSEGGVLISFQDTTGGDASSGTFIFGANDWKLADQFLACAVKDHNVDPKRVYATGCSAGGLFSTAMAATRSSYIAAAAPNSGGWSFPAQFDSAFVPALMTVHGAAGVDVVAIDFSMSSRTADMSFKGKGGFVINCDHGGGHCGGGSLSGDVWKFFKAHPYGTNPSPWKDALPAGFSSKCKIF